MNRYWTQSDKPVPAWPKAFIMANCSCESTLMNWVNSLMKSFKVHS